jgi:hypothetical protein
VPALPLWCYLEESRLLLTAAACYHCLAHTQEHPPKVTQRQLPASLTQVLLGLLLTAVAAALLTHRNTYSEGGTKEECQPCPFGSTAPAGSMRLEACVSVAQECPVGQMAPADAVSKEQCACYPGFGGAPGT